MLSLKLAAILSDNHPNYVEVQNLIEAGANPNTRNDKGDNYLHLTIQHGLSDLRILKAIQLGVGVNETNRKGQTAFQAYLNIFYSFNIENINTEIIQALIAAGADPLTCNKQGYNFLHLAIFYLLPHSILLQAINLGIKVNALNREGETALQACLNKNDYCKTKLIQAFIAAGADPNTRNKRGNNYLHMLLNKKEKSEESIIKALKIGIDVMQVNSEGETALQAYYNKSFHCNLKTIKAFIAAGASPNTRNKRGDNFLHLTIRRGWFNSTILNALRLGIDVNKSNKEGQNPLQLYLNNPYSISIEMIKALVHAGADINARNKNGDNCLHIAIRHCWSDSSILELLTLGIDVKENNREGETALQAYFNKRFHYNINIIQALIDTGANPHTRNNNGDNYLHMTIRDTQPDNIILEALSLGINVNRLNKKNQTAMQAYLESSNFLSIKVIEALILAGAHPNSKNHAGNNYLYLAIEAHAPLENIQKAIALGISANKRNIRGESALNLADQQKNPDPKLFNLLIEPDRIVCHQIIAKKLKRAGYHPYVFAELTKKFLSSNFFTQKQALIDQHRNTYDQELNTL